MNFNDNLLIQNFLPKDGLHAFLGKRMVEGWQLRVHWILLDGSERGFLEREFMIELRVMTVFEKDEDSCESEI